MGKTKKGSEGIRNMGKNRKRNGNRNSAVLPAVLMALVMALTKREKQKRRIRGSHCRAG